MKKKYLVNAGYVTSKTDGDQYYVGATDLMKLYGVDMADCLVASPRMNKKMFHKLEKELIVLRPLYHGGYDTYLDEHEQI